MVRKSRFAAGAQEHAAQYVRSAVRQGRWVAGDALDASAIASELQISPSPVREALARLRGEGLLETRHRDGYSLPILQTHQLAAEYRYIGAVAVQLALRGEAALQHERDLDVGYASRWEGLLVFLARSADMPAAELALQRSCLRLWTYVEAQANVRSTAAAELSHLEALASARRRRALADDLESHFADLVSHSADICRAVFERSKRFGKALE